MENFIGDSSVFAREQFGRTLGLIWKFLEEILWPSCAPELRRDFGLATPPTPTVGPWNLHRRHLNK